DEEKARSSERFTKAKDWYDQIFSDRGNVTLPAKEDIKNNTGIGNSVMASKISAEEVKNFCDSNHLSLNAFFTFAAGLSLKAYTGNENAVFATIYNGRNDSRLTNSISMFVKTIPVGLTFATDMSVVEAIAKCQTMLLNTMAYDIYSFAEICNAYNLNSDVLFAYQGENEHEDRILIGGKEAKEIELDTSQEQAKAPFGLDISLKGNNVIYEFEYDPSMYSNVTISHFFSLMENVMLGLIKVKSIAAVLSLSEVKKLSGEAVVKQETKETSSTTVSGSKAVVVDDRVKEKQLKVLEQQILEVYRKVLNNDTLELSDDFFEHGGTSLLAAKVMMALMVKDYPVVYQDVFDAPTVEKLAGLIFVKMIDSYAHNAPDDEESSEEVEQAQTYLFEKALSHNTAEYVDNIKKEKLGNVLVTGCTGFLGIHVLRELIDSDAEKIYCLVHKGNIDAEKRLKESYFFYFEELDESVFNSRIIPVNGDIKDRESLKVLEKYDIDTVINCAASVKHFAELEFLKGINYYGVKNLVKLCLERNMRLIHISTTSVAGDTLGDGKKYAVLNESVFDLGQEVESNAYVYTKYLAEKYILKAIEQKGLDAKIIRMGNLMSRYADGEFQINFNTNNFMNTLKAYAALGCYPVTELDIKDEFSPIDEVARATVLLAGTNSEFTVFHAYNSYNIEMGALIQALNDNDIKVDIVSEKEFNERLAGALKDDQINSYVSPLVNYNTDNDERACENDVENSFTIKALYRLGFRWEITDMDYINTAIAMLKTLGFFDVR
nr:SDR family oxidoreductase [Lachnospiraceae bacterium]